MQSKNTVGKFIVFEGLDCSGKSTQLDLLNVYLMSQGIETVRTFEPGDSKIYSKIRNVLLHDKDKIHPYSELFMFMADRAEHVRTVVLPALKNGKWVLCDRFTWSTVAYQGFGRGINVEQINVLNGIAANYLKPDLTIFIEIPLEKMFNRLNDQKDIISNQSESLDDALGIAFKRPNNIDKIESEKIEFFERVELGYEQLVANERIFNRNDLVHLNGKTSISDLSEKIQLNIFHKFLA